MNANVLNCEACGCKCYSEKVSLRGWCDECEKEFDRTMAQRRAATRVKGWFCGLCGSHRGRDQDGACLDCG